jgi:site-specific DNA-cytosine methylase
MKLLELFSGTKSVGKVATLLGYEVVSLDIKNADINTNILNWNYKTYETGYFNVIWASPPCTEYSIAKTVGVRKIEEANEVVLKTLEIIEYFNPKHFIVENPQTGLLKKQWFMYGLPYNDIDYCKYGMLYRKRTRLWNNVTLWKPQPLCLKDCGNTNGNKHIKTAQRGPSHGMVNDSFRQDDLYMVPAVLIHEIFNAIKKSLSHHL